MYDENGLLERTIPNAHSYGITRLKQLPNGLVASASDDKTVKIWSPTTDWSLIRTYTQHTSEVVGLEYISSTDNTIASGSWDGTIQIWSIN